MNKRNTYHKWTLAVWRMHFGLKRKFDKCLECITSHKDYNNSFLA